MQQQKSTSFAPSRRQLFTGNVGSGATPFRPPWAVPESDFDDTCTNCGDCIDVCPTRILSFGRGRLPVVDFSRNECTFCGKCESACEADALIKQEKNEAWNLTVSILNNCLSIQRITCRSCGDMCENEAISFRLELGGKATPTISMDDCTGCGACIAPCPSQSIQITRKTPQ